MRVILCVGVRTELENLPVCQCFRAYWLRRDNLSPDFDSSVQRDLLLCVRFRSCVCMCRKGAHIPG